MMSSASLESRVTALEAQYADILKLVQRPPSQSAWRGVVGMFATDPQIAELHQEAAQIREADRESTHNSRRGEG